MIILKQEGLCGIKGWLIHIKQQNSWYIGIYNFNISKFFFLSFQHKSPLAIYFTHGSVYTGEEKATHSSILVWRIPWTEEPGGLQSMGSQEWDTTQRLERESVCVLILISQPSHPSLPPRHPRIFSLSLHIYSFSAIVSLYLSSRSHIYVNT